MLTEQIEKYFRQFKDGKKIKSAGLLAMKEGYEHDPSFDGWSNYKRTWYLCRYDNNRAVSKSRLSAARSVRYAIYRCKNELTGGAAADDENRSVWAFYKDMPEVAALGGLINFAEAWDIDPTDETKVYKRVQSVAMEWQEHLAHTVKEMPEGLRKVAAANKLETVPEVVYDVTVNSDGSSFVEKRED